MRNFSSGATRDSDEEKYDEIEVAWAAGFYDGEGSTCCCANNGNPFTRIQFSIGQKDYNGKIADTLLRFKEVVKCGYIYRKTRIGKEINQHQFFICKPKDVEKVLRLLWKYLSKSKREQANKAFNLYDEGIKKLKGVCYA